MKIAHHINNKKCRNGTTNNKLHLVSCTISVSIIILTDEQKFFIPNFSEIRLKINKPNTYAKMCLFLQNPTKSFMFTNICCTTT